MDLYRRYGTPSRMGILVSACVTQDCPFLGRALYFLPPFPRRGQSIFRAPLQTLRIVFRSWATHFQQSHPQGPALGPRPLRPRQPHRPYFQLEIETVPYSLDRMAKPLVI